jgi:CubicO group peptidase (beta-lactamase class C family)
LATALATLIAVDRGRLSLDDPAGPSGSTVRHLLAHASGLPTGALPGTRRMYSNDGYELLGEVVGTAVGESFGAWLQNTVLAPLGMTATILRGSPAAGMVGPVADLVGLAAELQVPTLLSDSLSSAMRTVAFPGLRGVLPGFGSFPANDWGLGPEIRDHKSPHWTGRTNTPATFGHFGAAGGFLWVDPGAGKSLVVLTSLEFGPWAVAAWPALSDAVLNG